MQYKEFICCYQYSGRINIITPSNKQNIITNELKSKAAESCTDFREKFLSLQFAKKFLIFLLKQHFVNVKKKARHLSVFRVTLIHKYISARILHTIYLILTLILYYYITLIFPGGFFFAGFSD